MNGTPWHNASYAGVSRQDINPREGDHFGHPIPSMTLLSATTSFHLSWGSLPSEVMPSGGRSPPGWNGLLTAVDTRLNLTFLPPSSASGTLSIASSNSPKNALWSSSKNCVNLARMTPWFLRCLALGNCLQCFSIE